MTDAVLYELAFGESPPEHRDEAHVHLADCDACIQRLVAFQDAIQANQEVYAIWKPEVRHAAGEGASPSVVRHTTQDGKYHLTLQPSRDGQKDLLTLAVVTPWHQRLEGVQIMLVSSSGQLILQGIISGGTITRLIDRKWRNEWPFRIHPVMQPGG
jgi:hypothetical protein